MGKHRVVLSDKPCGQSEQQFASVTGLDGPFEVEVRVADGWIQTGAWLLTGLDAFGNEIEEYVPILEPKCQRGIRALTEGGR